MGLVYKAEGNKLERPGDSEVPRFSSAPRTVAARAFKEKRKLRRQLSNICTVYELVEATDKPFLALEFVEGAQ